jgi:KAP family P-loop domain
MRARSMREKAQGYDRTAKEADDKFGRVFLVDNVYDQLMAHDAKWSVTVALNGQWGSGKTSIAEMIESRALKAGHAVGWLYPWQVNTSKDVAIALTITVLKALEEAKIKLPAEMWGKKKLIESSMSLRQLRGIKAAEIGFSMLDDANAFDTEFAKPISKRLADEKKRLLVIIDDLDRCEPAFIAPLLLFMRSVLDIEGFSFLAPFDSDVVSKTLYASNTAWSSADRFLEKVFDFRIPIPDLTVEQKTQFLVSEFAKTPLPIGDSDARACATLLPGTPRAIKSLVRDIGAARREIERRSPDELSWPLLLLARMLQATSLEFFRVYLHDVVDAVEEKQWQQRTGEQRTSDLNVIWDVVAHPDPSTKRRVRQLVEALEQSPGGIDHLRHMLHFTDEHEPVTQKEFEEFVDRRLAFGLAQAWGQLQISKNRPRPEVGAYLASHAIGGYLRALEEISQAVPPSRRDHRLNQVKRGEDYLTVATELLRLIGDAQADQRFNLFLRLLVTERDSDRAIPDTDDLHANALRVLEQLCASAQADWVRYDGCISDVLSLSGKQADIIWRVQVSTALRQQMKENARAELLRLLQLPNGLDGIFRGRSSGTQLGLMADIFLDPCDAFWEETNAPAVLAAGMSQPVIRENAGAAIHGILKHVSVEGSDVADWGLMRMAMESRPPYSVEGLIVRFLRSEVQLRIIWNAYASGRSGDADTEQTRAKLTLLGAPLAAIGKD